uniref:metallothionein n=1 Tax=Trichocoleus desertorum TaxID=1481672 RepID=UPI0025B526F4|nr:metallothionein [Trichocoleus desertorum]
MTAVSQMKCACDSCLCIVSPNEQAVQRDGKYYCSDACANGHASGEGCGHTGCECH